MTPASIRKTSSSGAPILGGRYVVLNFVLLLATMTTLVPYVFTAMAGLLLLGYHVFRMGGWFLAGWGLCAAVLVYEHSILREDDLSRLNVAFFNLNGIVSIALCVFTYLDLAL